MHISTQHNRIAEALASLAFPEDRIDPRNSPSGEMAEYPLVSVVTVTFNAEEAISGAIQSVIEQTYRNIEHIIIDGNSTDRTNEIIASFGDSIALHIVEADNGIYDAMNKGILNSKGHYIVILNSDDRLDPNFIKRSVEEISASNADITYCNYRTESSVVRVGRIDDGILLSQLGVKHNTFLVSRNAYQEVGLFDPTLRVVSDARWNRTAYCRGLKFHHIDETLVFYSTAGLSASRTDEVKKVVISESVSLLKLQFPFLSSEECEHLYLSNFSPRFYKVLIDVLTFNGDSGPLLRSAILSMLSWNFQNRDGYRIKEGDVNRAREILTLVKECPALGVFVRPEETPVRWISALHVASRIATKTQKRVILHFARRFSTPSETFIYDFLKSISQKSESEETHVFLCDERLMENERPFDQALCVPYDGIDPSIREMVYGFILEILDPSLFVAHFALNGWVLYERIPHIFRNRPFLNMCHGIDVFAIGDNAEYTSYIRDYCADASNVRFTCVSRYLEDLLIQSGIPKSKIDIVPNSYNPVFGGAQKERDFWSGQRPLRILAVGRLIKWKGMDILLESLGELRRTNETDWTLNIVYGGFDQELANLKVIADAQNITERVTFTPFVNFADEPTYFSRYDLFILPSTVDDANGIRTETFGVACLEALICGLPVITTNAGGLPEVVGDDSDNVVMVQHGAAEPLCVAIRQMLADPSNYFCSHRDVVSRKRSEFSPSQRDKAWRACVDRLLNRSKPRILHFCALARGGAAGATLNIHRGLLRRGWDSFFVTRDNQRNQATKYLPNVIYLDTDLEFDFDQGQPSRKKDMTIYSVDWEYLSWDAIKPVVEGADVINLTWTARFLSTRNIRDLSNLGIPLVITIRDMHPITGGCHFFHGCEEWRDTCHSCPQSDRLDFGIAFNSFQYKLTNWNWDNIEFIGLSEHSVDIFKNSPFYSKANLTHISNYVDFKVFFPEQVNRLSEFPEVPERAILIGFLPSFDSAVKGYQQIKKAMKIVKQAAADKQVCLLVVSDRQISSDEFPCSIVQIPPITDKQYLRRFYNACDAIAVPSLEETFSNTAIEALACGTRVLGFKTGVMYELSHDSRYGSFVEVGDTLKLADAIINLEKASDEDRGGLSKLIKDRYNEDSILEKYTAYFQRRMSKPRTISVTSPNDSAVLRNSVPAAKFVASQRYRRDFSFRDSLRKKDSELHNLKRSMKSSSEKNNRGVLPLEVREVKDDGGYAHVVFGSKGRVRFNLRNYDVLVFKFQIIADIAFLEFRERSVQPFLNFSGGFTGEDSYGRYARIKLNPDERGFMVGHSILFDETEAAEINGIISWSNTIVEWHELQASDKWKRFQGGVIVHGLAAGREIAPPISTAQ